MYAPGMVTVSSSGDGGECVMDIRDVSSEAGSQVAGEPTPPFVDVGSLRTGEMRFIESLERQFRFDDVGAVSREELERRFHYIETAMRAGQWAYWYDDLGYLHSFFEGVDNGCSNYF